MQRQKTDDGGGVQDGCCIARYAAVDVPLGGMLVPRRAHRHVEVNVHDATMYTALRTRWRWRHSGPHQHAPDVLLSAVIVTRQSARPAIKPYTVARCARQGLARNDSRARWHRFSALGRAFRYQKPFQRLISSHIEIWTKRSIGYVGPDSWIFETKSQLLGQKPAESLDGGPLPVANEYRKNRFDWNSQWR